MVNVAIPQFQHLQKLYSWIRTGMDTQKDGVKNSKLNCKLSTLWLTTEQRILLILVQVNPSLQT
jgi:hypothetical protein